MRPTPKILALVGLMLAFFLLDGASPGEENGGARASLLQVAAFEPAAPAPLCMSSPTPSCSVYSSCFAKYCPCAGDPNEYFETYGLKYCKAFLGNASFSEQGKKWRDSTLVCLQEAIVPKLDISTTPKCNCAEMRSFAFQSHVSCYTQPANSICDLPVADLNEIRRIVSVGDMLSGDGRKQMSQVAGICAGKAPDDGRRSVWKALTALIGSG